MPLHMLCFNGIRWGKTSCLVWISYTKIPDYKVLDVQEQLRNEGFKCLDIGDRGKLLDGISREAFAGISDNSWL